MEKLKYYFMLHKKKIITIFGVIFFTFGLISLMLINNKYKASDETFDDIAVNEINQEEKKNEEVVSKIKVDVKGAVVNPYVYELDFNSRVIDAINAAGGLLENAYTRHINLSKILKDEDVIIVNTIEEINLLNEKEKLLFILD